MVDTIEEVNSVFSFIITMSEQTHWCHISSNLMDGVFAGSGGNCMSFGIGVRGKIDTKGEMECMRDAVEAGLSM